MRIRYLIATLVAAFVLNCSQSNRVENMPIDMALQEAMDESMKNSDAVGVSAAIIFPDGTLWKGASGISHAGVPVTPDMLFDIGSIEKNFQAALALLLVEEGLFSLDDPLEKWFPPHPHIDGKITIRQLLNMTSGIDNFVEDSNSPFRIGYKNIDYKKMWTWEEIYNDFIGESNFEPGTKCEYSTTNYIILKHIIEKATQVKQTAVFENRILQPVHLHHTLAEFFKPIPETMPIVHGWMDISGDGTADDISEFSLNWIASLSPMLVYSTPVDMVQWIDVLYHNKTVLNPGMLDQMLTFFRPVQNEPMMKGYGLGIVDINLWTIFSKWEDVRVYGHLGSTFGYTTFTGYFPDLEISVAIMFNRGCDRQTDRAVATVSEAVFDVLFRHLGLVESQQKGSLSDMVKILETSPDDVHLMYRIAKQQQANGDDDDALLTYEKILEQDSEDNFGYKTDALFWKASYDGVIRKNPENLITFIADHPDYKQIQDAYKWLAKIYERRTEMDKAIQVYHDALKTFDKDTEFFNDYAWWVYENELADEYGTAILYAQKAVALDPGAYYTWDTLAQLWFVSGEQQKAEQASEKALSLAPRNQREEYEKALNRIKNGRN